MNCTIINGFKKKKNSLIVSYLINRRSHFALYEFAFVMENNDSSMVKLYFWELSVAAVTDVGQRGVKFLTGTAAKSLNVY